MGRARIQAKKSSGETPLPGDSGLPPCAFCHVLRSLTGHLLQAPISFNCGIPSAFQSLTRYLTPLSRTTSPSCRWRWPCAVCAALAGSTDVATPLGDVRACNVDDKEQGHKEQGYKGAPWGGPGGKLRPPLWMPKNRALATPPRRTAGGKLPGFLFFDGFSNEIHNEGGSRRFPAASPELLALFA